MKKKFLTAAVCFLFVLVFALCSCSENSSNGQIEKINASINHVSVDESNIDWENIPLTPESEFETKIMGDEIDIIGYLGHESTVNIPQNIAGKPVKHINIKDCEDIVNLKIPDGLTYLPSAAFSNCTHLVNVYLPDSIILINFMLFDGCTKLTNINIPKNVKFIDPYAFRGCSSLLNIDFPDSVEYIGLEAFKGTPWLEKQRSENPMVVVNDILVDANTFTGEEYEIPEHITAISEGAFWNCTNLKSVTIPDGVKEIGSFTFHNCSNLTDINIPENVTVIDGYAFSGCNKLVDLVLPDSVEEIEKTAFQGSKNIVVKYKNKTYDYAHIEELYELLPKSAKNDLDRLK